MASSNSLAAIEILWRCPYLLPAAILMLVIVLLLMPSYRRRFVDNFFFCVSFSLRLPFFHSLSLFALSISQVYQFTLYDEQNRHTHNEHLMTTTRFECLSFGLDIKRCENTSVYDLDRDEQVGQADLCVCVSERVVRYVVEYSNTQQWILIWATFLFSLQYRYVLVCDFYSSLRFTITVWDYNSINMRCTRHPTNTEK